MPITRLMTRTMKPTPMPIDSTPEMSESTAPMAMRPLPKTWPATMSETTTANCLPMPSKKDFMPAITSKILRVRISSKTMAMITESTIAVGTPTLILMPQAPITVGLKMSRMKSGIIGSSA